MSLVPLFQIVLAALGLLLLLIVAVLLVVLVVRGRKSQVQSSDIVIVDMSGEYEDIKDSMQSALMSKLDWKQYSKLKKSKNKQEADKHNAFVIDFEGDTKASQVDELGNVVTAILLAAKITDRVVLRLESPGGLVHTYGLAAAQLERLRHANIPITVCVDKVAASGGYMMAVLADRLIAAPFAIVGSIGVVASVPNFHKILRKNDIDYMELTAGEYKRTVSVFGEITAKGKEKFVEQLEDTQVLFKEHVGHHRKALDLSKVATGEYWYGKRALDLGLVDDLMTSSQYLMSLLDSHKIFHISVSEKETFADKVKGFVTSSMRGYLDTLIDEKNRKHWLIS